MNIRRYIDIAIRREIRRWADDDFTKIKAQAERCRKFAQEIEYAIDDENGGDETRPHEQKLLDALEGVFLWMNAIKHSDQRELIAKKQNYSNSLSTVMSNLNRSIPSIKQTFPQYVQRSVTILNIMKDIQNRIINL